MALYTLQKNKNEGAFAIVEILITSSIAVFLAAALFSSGKSIFSYQLSFKERLEDERAAETVYQLIKNAFEAASPLNGALKTWRIQKSYKIVDANGNEYDEPALNKFPLKKESLLATFLETDFINVLYYRKNNRYCLNGSKDELKKAKEFLVFSMQGYAEFQVSFKEQVKNENYCGGRSAYEISEIKKVSDFFNYFFSPAINNLSNTELIGTPLLIVPIRDIFSLYVDTDNVFRRVSHLTSSNQPLLNDVKQMRLQEISYDQNLYYFLLEIEFPNNKKKFRRLLPNSKIEDTKFLDLLL